MSDFMWGILTTLAAFAGLVFAALCVYLVVLWWLTRP